MAAETNDPDYRWRPATKGDIGSVARFGDTDSKQEPWSYGILKAIVKDEMYGWQFTCEANVHLDEDEQFMHCQVQYDANKFNTTRTRSRKLSQQKVDLRVAIENAIEQAADACHDATLWWQPEEKGPRIIDTLVSMVVLEIEKRTNQSVQPEGVTSVPLSSSVRVVDGMQSVQLPARLVCQADLVLSEMLHRGETSPELVVRYEKTNGSSAWWCEFGAFKVWSSTPWAALSRLATCLREV